MRTYSDLIKIPTFEERYLYLQMPSQVGIATFGFERYLNQTFYTSREWRLVRNKVIARDEAFDLAIRDRPIYGNVRVHHMNHISVEDFRNENFDMILDPEFLICTSLDTHNAIHFGTEDKLKQQFPERKRGDTCPWKVF